MADEIDPRLIEALLLDRARVRPGELPYLPPLPPSGGELRPAAPAGPSISDLLSRPLEYFRARGEHMAGMTPEAQIDALNEAASPAREMTGIPGAVRAGEAAGEAAIDPSITNLAKAGAATGVALGRPGVALGALGAGYGGAIAKDLGLLDPSSASAAELTGRQQRMLEIERQRSEQASKLRKEEADAEAARNLKSQATAKDRELFDRQMKAAEDRLQAALSQAKRGRFEDTETKKFYDATAGYTPAIAPFATGFVSRLAGGNNPMAKTYIPVGMGGFEGIVGANAPLGWDAYIGPPANNPTKEAYEEYARDMPPTDPSGAPTRRAEWMEYARGLPKENPIRSAASDEFYDKAKLAERSGLGLTEGIVGGKGGSLLASLLARGASALAYPFRGQGGSQLPPPGGSGGPGSGGLPPGSGNGSAISGTQPITLVPAKTATPLIEKMRAGEAVAPPEGQLPAVEGNANQRLVEALRPANRNFEGPAHHSNYQPRDHGKFKKGKPDYPDEDK